MPTRTDGASGVALGTVVVGTLFLGSLAVSVYHFVTHSAPLPAELLGQWSLFGLTVGFGFVSYSVLGSADGAAERDVVGFRAGAGYVLAGLASGGYALHQHVTPEAGVALDVVLFQATFVALVGGTAGLVAGLEKARRQRTVTEMEAATRELEAVQSAIRTEKQRFESLFRNAPTAVADLRYAAGDPTVERANPAFDDLLADGTTEVEGRHLFEVVPLCEPETETEMAAHVGANEVYEAEVTVDREERRHFKLRVIPYEVGKEGDRAFALYTDVTELRTTQQGLADSVDRLGRSNERLQQFAYAVSHDLQEPLRMVSSYVQLLERRYGDELDEDAAEFIEFAVDGADRMRDMIDALLEYSRVETQGDSFDPVDLDAVFDDVREDLQFKIEETDAEITVEGLPLVRGDGNQLRQLFQNLLENAVEYSGDDPPQVRVSAERRAASGPGDGRAPDVARAPADSGGEWVVSVHDEGVGIPADDQDRVFEVFQRLHADEHAGTGIGLALCERIVDRHGGDIWVESEPGEGSTFYVTLPAADDGET